MSDRLVIHVPEYYAGIIVESHGEPSFGAIADQLREIVPGSFVIHGAEIEIKVYGKGGRDD